MLNVLIIIIPTRFGATCAMASDFYVLLFSMYSLSVSLLFFSVYINNSVFDILGVVFINYCPIESQ